VSARVVVFSCVKVLFGMPPTFEDEQHAGMKFAYGFCSKNFGVAVKEFSRR